MVEKNKYEFKNSTHWSLISVQQIGHGSFLLFHHGNSYSHSNKEQNYVGTDFKYEVGDVIRVETKEEVLLFVNETKKKEWTLKLSLTEDEWKQACFCVELDCKNDTASIMWKCRKEQEQRGVIWLKWQGVWLLYDAAVFIRKLFQLQLIKLKNKPTISL